MPALVSAVELQSRRGCGAEAFWPPGKLLQGAPGRNWGIGAGFATIAATLQQRSARRSC